MDAQKVTRTNTALQKIPPNNLEAERSVIAAILLDNDALPKAIEILKEDDFYLEAHRTIFHVITNLFEENEVIDVKWFDINKLPEKIAFDHKKVLEEFRKEYFD